MSEDKVISKKIINEFGVPLDGSIVESMGKTTKVPDYITGLTPLQLANLALETAKGSLRGRSSAETAEAISGGEKDTARTIASVVEGIPRLVTDLAEPIVKKFYPEKAEEFRDASTDMLKLIGAGVSKATGVDEEDIIDSETGKAKFSETIPGLAVDMGTILFTGGALFKKIDDAIPNAEKFSGKVYNATKNLKINIPAIKNWLAYVAKAEVAYAGASQLLIDPDASLPNVLKSLDLETLKKDNPFADLINYLVTEKEEPELKKRASMLVSDLMAGGAFMTVLKALGMTGKGALNFVKGKIRGKEPDADEMEALVGELLPAMRQETRPNKELPLIAGEDTAEGLKQVKKQAMAGKSIKEIAPTILYRTKQRWFTRRGFYSPILDDAHQASVRNRRSGDNEIFATTARLETSVNSYVQKAFEPNQLVPYIPPNQLVPKGSSIPAPRAATPEERLENIHLALRENILKLDLTPDEAVNHLSRKFNLPEDLAQNILESRNLIDNLSREFLKTGGSPELIREVITADLGQYMNRSYKLKRKGNWRPPVKAIDDAQRHFEDLYILKKFPKQTREVLSDEQLERAVSAGRIQVDEILGDNRKEFNSFVSNKQRVNEGILEEKKYLSPEVRALMGEDENPSFQVLVTANKLVDLTQSKMFFNKVGEAAATAPRYPRLYQQAVDNARKEAKAQVHLQGLKIRYGVDVPEKQFVVFDDGDKVGQFVGKTEAGLYNIEYKNVQGKLVTVERSAADLEIVVSDKMLDDMTRIEYERLGSGSNNLPTAYKEPTGTERVKPTPSPKIGKSFIEDGTYIDKDDVSLYVPTKYIYTFDEAPPEWASTRISGTGSYLDGASGNTEDGYYTSSEIAKSLEGLQDTFAFSRALSNNFLVNSWRWIKATVQRNKTVLDSTTQVRNGIGGVQMMGAQGWLPGKNGKIAMSIINNQLGSMGDVNKNTMQTYFKKMGIANTQIQIGEWEALFKKADGSSYTDFTTKISELVTNSMNRVPAKFKPSWDKTISSKWIDGSAIGAKDSIHTDPFDLPQKIYAEVDNFFKISTWFSELDTLRKARAWRYPLESKEESLKFLKESMDEAAEIVRNNLPNYDFVPHGFKSLKDIPRGNFVSFTPESIRTTMHTLTRAFKELSSGNPVKVKRGAARLTGQVLVNSAWLYVAPVFVHQKMGISDEVNDAMQIILESPWSVKHNKIIGRWGDSIYYVDPTYLNPFDWFSTVANTVLSNYNKGMFLGAEADKLLGDAFINVLSESMHFATDEALSMKAITDMQFAYQNQSGRSEDGTPIFHDIESRTPENLIADGLKFAGFSVGPGFITDIDDLISGINKTPQRSSGQIKSAKSKIVELFTGVSVKKADFEMSLKFKADTYHSAVNYRLPEVSVGFVKDSDIDKEFTRYANAVIKQQAVKFEKDQEFYRMLEAFKSLPTYTPTRIRKILKEKNSRISEASLNALLKGKFKSKYPSDVNIKEAKEKLKDHPDFFILEKYLDSIDNTPLTPKGQGILTQQTKEEIKDIKNGKRFWTSPFYSGSFETIKKRINKKHAVKFSKGGEVDVPNAPDEPDERIDKLTGLPYNVQAGEAYRDEEDPLRRLGFASGGEIDPLARLGFGQGSIVGTVKEAAGSVFKTLKKLVTKSSAVDVSKGGKYLGTESKTRFNADLATRIIAANKNVPFVKRMTDTNDPNYTSSISMEGGKATHAMADRGAFVYPTIFVNSKTNKLERLEDSAAWKRAKETGEFIEFNTEEQAQWFARNNYKKAKQVKQFFNNFNLAQKDKVLNTLKTFGTGDIRPDLKVEAIDPPVETFGTGDIRPEIKVNADDLTANMLNVFEYTLADSKNPRIMELTKEERKGYAKFLTAQALHESERFNEESGTFNYSGRKATQAQIKAGKAREVGTYEMVDGHRVDTRGYFTDFSSLDDFATKQVNYLNRQFPKFFKAKTYDQAIAALFKGENNGVYATDMFKNVINFPDIKENIIDTNPLTNQYSIKVANYLGHGNEGFLTPKPRPDMNIIKKKNAKGKYNEAWVTSPIGKEGTLTSRRGINNKQYINQDLYNELVPNEATIIGQEKER